MAREPVLEPNPQPRPDPDAGHTTLRPRWVQEQGLSRSPGGRPDRSPVGGSSYQHPPRLLHSPTGCAHFLWVPDTTKTPHIVRAQQRLPVRGISQDPGLWGRERVVWGWGLLPVGSQCPVPARPCLGHLPAPQRTSPDLCRHSLTSGL